MEKIISNVNILDKLCCSKCFKYLSVLPVKIYPDNSVLCGRCTEPGDLGIRSLYCDLVENMYFKCVNHVEGCDVLMNPFQLVEHEVNCISTKVQCPICDLVTDSFLMYKHFRNFHAKQLLKRPELKITFLEDVTSYWMYKYDDVLAMIEVNVDKESSTVFLDCRDFGFKKKENLLRYFIEISDNHGNRSRSVEFKCLPDFKEDVFSSKAPGALSLTYTITFNFFGYVGSNFQQIQTGRTPENIVVSDKLTRIIFLSDDFKTKYPDWKLTLNKRAIISLDGCITSQGFCSECQNIIGSVALKCQNNGSCDRCSNSKNHLLPFYNSLLFYCIWNCGEYFASDQLYQHENICKARIPIICPVPNCSKRSSNTETLQEHFNFAHNQLLLISDNDVMVPKVRLRNVIIYFRHVFINLNVKLVDSSDFLTYHYYATRNSVSSDLIEEDNFTYELFSKVDGKFVKTNPEGFEASTLVVKLVPKSSDQTSI